ncbi:MULTISPECIES: mobilization protein [Bacteroidales]|uniref:mobilization protein n=1 Tax=Bacteroidales TaxID=171549 RepID=UPI0008210BDC|nr:MULTISPECIES: mobilization protein [Bacteroides]MCS2409712.1 mobilization protein [Phocaeicola vulgatus]MCS2482820.1 mobilization protein [Bacteroides thetaiotaomicron]MCS3075520.1 mobilization protein [Bacteroides thetaiotaomicron]MDB0698251.1 mobilization protein [Bacteroides xylanisolvens]MDB0707947.1 mobilization protein [Bacteroides xylanisolvens]
MATKSSIHIKPCNIASSEAHNKRTAEYMRNIGESRIYVVPELSTDNEQWINPDFGSPDLRTHYDYIRQMVKEKTGRAMQEKERERKGKNGKIIKVAGCSPIREGVLLVRSDTTLADVRKFGEECQRRWGITPLQIFLHKDEGHWLNGQPEAEDRESFQVGNRWFKPNYHAHIVFDWMNHETGKSRKLNDEDMTEMQSMASDILLMERGRSKAVTGREHLERNDFIIEKQKAELQRIDAAKRHTERQVNFAEQELRQVKSEIRTDKLKSAATDAATAIASGVGSLFGSGKMKELGRANERLQDEVSKRDADIKKLQTHIQQMQKQHDTQIHNLREMHRQELDMKEKELSRLGRIIDKAFRWFPMFREMLRMEKLCAMLGFSREMTERLVVRKEAMKCSGKIYSEQHRRNFDVKDDVFRVENDPDDENRLSLTVNRKPIADWFREQWNRLRYGTRQPQQEERQGRGMKL